MPPKKQKKRANRTRSDAIDFEKLEKLIRNSVRSEISGQQSRQHTTDTYAQRLLETDRKVTEFIQQAITETTHTSKLSVYSYIFSYVAALLILLTGVKLIFSDGNNSTVISGIFIVGGILWMISLQGRNLAKNNRSLVNNLAKLNIIFAGYTRQIHQVDALFEEMVGNNGQMTTETAEKLLNNLQDAMSEAMSAVTTISIETEE
jgi:hypothetical protein